MGFIDNSLMSGEKVIYRAKLHWIVFKWAIMLLFLAFFMMVDVGENAIGGFLLAAIVGAFNFIKLKTSEMGVTNKRVLIKVGLIKRHSLETLLEKVEGIQVVQSALGRILGYGTIVVVGSGGTREPFSMIDNPMKFRKKVQEQISFI
jgi:uncharacterized membrane protein YdbT with pleckstrin-like domain